MRFKRSKLREGGEGGEGEGEGEQTKCEKTKGQTKAGKL